MKLIFIIYSIVIVFKIHPIKAGSNNGAIQNSSISGNSRLESVMLSALDKLTPSTIKEMTPHLKEVANILRQKSSGNLLDFLYRLAASRVEPSPTEVQNSIQLLIQISGLRNDQTPTAVVQKVENIYPSDNKFQNRATNVRDESVYTNHEPNSNMSTNNNPYQQPDLEEINAAKSVLCEDLRKKQNEVEEALGSINIKIKNVKRWTASTTAKVKQKVQNVVEASNRQLDENKEKVSEFLMHLETVELPSTKSRLEEMLIRDMNEVKIQFNAFDKLGLQIESTSDEISKKLENCENSLNTQLVNLRKNWQTKLEELRKIAENKAAELVIPVEVKNAVVKMKSDAAEVRKQMEQECKNVVHEINGKVESVLKKMKNMNNEKAVSPSTVDGEDVSKKGHSKDEAKLEPTQVTAEQPSVAEAPSENGKTASILHDDQGGYTHGDSATASNETGEVDDFTDDDDHHHYSGDSTSEENHDEDEKNDPPADHSTSYIGILPSI